MIILQNTWKIFLGQVLYKQPICCPGKSCSKRPFGWTNCRFFYPRTCVFYMNCIIPRQLKEISSSWISFAQSCELQGSICSATDLAHNCILPAYAWIFISSRPKAYWPSKTRMYKQIEQLNLLFICNYLHVHRFRLPHSPPPPATRSALVVVDAPNI